MQHEALKNHQLAFLLSLSALPIAGCVAGDDDSTTNATTNATTSASSTMSAGTDNTETSMSTTDNSTSGNSTTVGSSTTYSDTGYADSTTGPIDIPPVCMMYGDHLTKCMVMYADGAAMYCAAALMYDQTYGDACVMADTDYYACLAMTDCAELNDMMATPCEAELNAYMMACGGGSGSSSGGSTSTTM